MSEKISLVGLGKLGLCLAACYAEQGFDVLGVDIEERVVRSVNEGIAPWFEPGLSELLAKHGGQRLRATLSHREAIETTDLTIVLVATPSTPEGSFSNRFIEAALRSLSKAFSASSKAYHLFVISSTVMPGSIESNFIPLMEKYSGRKVRQDFDVCYDPDFVALGNVVKGFLKPDLVVIGETRPEAGKCCEALHHQLCENGPTIARMSIASAELTKVCLNAYITLKISFANSVANLCEKIPGADVDAITKAIGTDRRISPYYFQGGLSFGGTCFPRDTRAYLTIAQKYGVVPELIQAVERVNQFQDQHLAEVVLREVALLENKTVGILGLAFTMNTPVITESPALKLVKELLKHDLHIVAYDPLAIDTAKGVLGSAIEYVDSPQACLLHAGLGVVTLRLPELKQAVETFVPAEPLTIVDCWRQIDPAQLHEQVRHVALGRLEREDRG